VVPAACAKLWATVRTNSRLTKTFQDVSEESLELMERALGAGRQNHETVPKNMEAMRALVTKQPLAEEEASERARRLAARQEALADSGDKTASGGSFRNMDDEDQVEKDYAKSARKSKKDSDSAVQSALLEESPQHSATSAATTPEETEPMARGVPKDFIP